MSEALCEGGCKQKDEKSYSTKETVYDRISMCENT